jgi:hypothetical protein
LRIHDAVTICIDEIGIDAVINAITIGICKARARIGDVTGILNILKGVNGLFGVAARSRRCWCGVATSTGIVVASTRWWILSTCPCSASLRWGRRCTTGIIVAAALAAAQVIEIRRIVTVVTAASIVVPTGVVIIAASGSSTGAIITGTIVTCASTVIGSIISAVICTIISTVTSTIIAVGIIIIPSFIVFIITGARIQVDLTKLAGLLKKPLGWLTLDSNGIVVITAKTSIQ